MMFSLLLNIIKKVLTAGVFDYLHPGHKHYLEQAKKLGKTLVVIIARDKNVVKIKGFYPHQNEQERKNNVEKLNIADEVFLGKEGGNFLEIIEEIKPNILAMGYDQKIPHDFSEKFPDIDIVQIESRNPEKWKSSIFRKKTL